MLTLLAALLIGVPADGSESPRGVAKLAILQGMLEGKAGENGEYKAFKAGDEIEAGTMLRTASGTKASVDFSDGSELRIAESTEVSVDDPRKVGLQHGHIYVKIVRGSKRFEIAFLQLGVSADAAVVDVEYTPRVKDGPPAATMIRVIDGMARATSPKFGANVFSGFGTTALGLQLNTPNPLRNGSLETSWVHTLLAERARPDEETSNRSTELIQILSREPANDPGEAALRSLGDLAAAELARFVGRSTSEAQAARRATAARIVAETGTIKSAGALLQMLPHADPQVRLIAAHGLARLAGGKDLGFNDQYWKGETLAAGQKAWEDWIRQNSK